MLVNLHRPYGVQASYQMDMVFYTKDGDDSLLFPPSSAITLYCRALNHAVSARWTLSRNLLTTPLLTGVGEGRCANTFCITLPTAHLLPGFYDLMVTVDTGADEPVTGLCTFGYCVEEMPIQQLRPADFTAFWTRAKAELATIPLQARECEPRFVLRGEQIDEYNRTQASLPGAYDPDGHRYDAVEVCQVNFASINGLRVHGWLAKPVGEGPFPAMLVLPGAGFNSRSAPVEHARHGYLALDVQIHGQRVDQDSYDPMPGSQAHDTVYDPVEQFYPYNIYLNAVQAVNYLASRADVDATRIVTVGGSQGGRLSLTTAALDSRIAATVASITHYAYLPYNTWAEQMNKVGNDGMAYRELPPPPDTPEWRCLPYYDVLSFAPDVRCPAMMLAGLVDRVSPATTVYAAYRELGSAEKSLACLPSIAHDWCAEFDRRAWRWLDNVLNRQLDLV